MRKYAVALTFLLVASGCGGSSDTAAPVTTVASTTTVAPTTTQAPTTTAVPTATTEASAATEAPTTVPAPTTSVAQTVTEAPTTTAPGPAGLAAACAFDDSVPEITCHASGTTQGSQLRWESNISGWTTGPSYEIRLEQEHQLVPEVVVTLQECQGSNCQTVEASVDTSILVPSQSGSSTTTTAPSMGAAPTPTTAPTFPTTSMPASESGKSIFSNGFAELVDVEDGLAAWISTFTTIKTISLAEPSAPFVVGDADTLGTASGVFADEDYIYSTGSEGFAIFDVDSPMGEPLSTYDFGWSNTIIVEGGIAYLAAGSDLLILDVHDPTAPVELSRTQFVGTAPIKQLLVENLLYLPATIGGGLHIIDVSQPSNPEQLSLMPFESNSVGLGVRGNYAYLGYNAGYISSETSHLGFESSSVLDIVDISVPSDPKTVSSISLPTDIRDLILVDDLAYIVGSFENELLIVDVSNPIAPVLLETPGGDFSGSSYRFSYQYGDHAYLADSGTGIRVLDLGDPLNPTVVARLDLQMELNCLHGFGAMLYVCGSGRYFSVADVADPDKPTHLYTGVAPSGSFPISDLLLHNNKLVFGGNVYDLSEPSSPEPLPHIEADTLMARDDYLFTTIGEIGLIAYDISNWENLLKISVTPFALGIPWGASHDGDWVVGASTIPYSITLLNVADPYSPVVTDTLVLNEMPRNVTVNGDYVYLAHGVPLRGVDIFLIDPEGKLVLKTNIANVDNQSVTIVSDRAYIVSGGGTITIFDIDDPTQPKHLGSFSTRGMSEQAKVLDGYIYVADGDYGLTVMKLDTD